MEHTDRWLDLLFGMGDDTHPYWLMAVRVNILAFLACAAVAIARDARRWRSAPGARAAAMWVLGLTALAAGLRFFVASANLLDFGGIPYSRLLLGYKGHFATAQVYSLLYGVFGRTIENAILFNRIAGTLTIPLVYVLCRLLWRDPRVARSAAFLFAVSPVHVIFSASDALSIFTMFLCAASYVLVAGAVRAERTDESTTPGWYGGLLGLVLLTQVRYENVLFLLPAALFVAAHWRRLAPRSLAAPLLVAAGLLGFYTWAALAAGLSYQNPVRLGPALEMVWRHVVCNQLTAVPLLLLASLAVFWRGWRAGALALSPWLAALGLPLLAESGHGAVRVYCSWLILVLPAAALGLASLLSMRRRAARAVAVVVLAVLGAQPLLAWSTLSSRYLEIREHEFFRRAVASLAAGAAGRNDVEAASQPIVLVLPDDELLRRRFGSTVELFNKYSMTLAGMPEVARRVRLMRLTEFLEGDRAAACDAAGCVFLRGLPCLRQSVYPFTRDQCEALAHASRLAPITETAVAAAPFRDCAVYVGRLRRELCEAMVLRDSFGLYRIESR